MSPQETNTITLKINKAVWAICLTIAGTFGTGGIFIIKSYVRLESRFAVQDERERTQGERDSRQDGDIKDLKSDVKTLYSQNVKTVR